MPNMPSIVDVAICVKATAQPREILDVVTSIMARLLAHGRSNGRASIPREYLDLAPVSLGSFAATLGGPDRCELHLSATMDPAAVPAYVRALLQHQLLVGPGFLSLAVDITTPKSKL
jgi:hypothetical protein